jgi:methanogenic corrinoid protein MtbC1
MNNVPLFNLKAVIRMTGLSADTLRAWERRYHLPVPERTSGGHRLYSQGDIAIIQWLMAKQSEGISISNSVGLWNTLVANGTDPLEIDPHTAIDHTVSFPMADMDTSISSLRGKWVEACIDYDENLADQITNKAFALTTPEIVCNDVFLKGLSVVGEGWYKGEITVQQEHFATGIVHRRLGSLINSCPPPNRKEMILLCCPHGEEHTLSSTYLTYLLRRQGYKVIDLGANVPIAQLNDTIQRIDPQLVVLSALLLITAAQLKRMVKAIASSISIGFGGCIFKVNPCLKGRIPAFYVGETHEEAVTIIDNIFHKKHLAPIEEVENPYQKLSGLFEQKTLAINHQLSTKLPDWDFSLGTLSEATYFFNNTISAALFLGDLDLLFAEMQWIEGFLTNRQFAERQVFDYFFSYIECVNHEIGKEATPLTNWLDAYISKRVILSESGS